MLTNILSAQDCVDDPNGNIAGSNAGNCTTFAVWTSCVNEMFGYDPAIECPVTCDTCAECGDGTCSPGETAADCPADCPVCDDAPVCINILNVDADDTGAGTLDIHMVNQPGCTYYEGTTQKFATEGSSVEIAGTSIAALTETDCNTYSTVYDPWFDGAVSGIQFVFSNHVTTWTGSVTGGRAVDLGWTITVNPDFERDSDDDGTVDISGTMIQGFDFSLIEIPPGEGALMTVAFTDYDDDGICFLQDCSTGACLNECSTSELVDGQWETSNLMVDWGECYCPGGEVVDCAGVCGGTVVEDCAGECGGDAVVDDCGVCDGDNSSCDEVLEATLSFGQVDLESQTIEINLENSAPVSGFQFEVNTSITITDVSSGTAEEMGFIVDFSENNNIVLGFSIDGNEIPEGSDVLTVLGFDGYGQYSVCLSSGIIISGYGDAQYFDVSYGDCITLDYMKGDLNMDESLDILDIVIVINIIFEYIDPTEYQLWAADYSSDGAIDIMDIVQIINCILNDNCAGSGSGDGYWNDIDGNIYETVQIGEQLWMAENLKVTHYQNGDEIPTGYSNSEWAELETGAYTVYDYSNYQVTYGNLYNWYAVDDHRGVCPDGWHVPTDEEFMELEIYLGMSEEEANSTGLRGTDEGSQLAGNSDLWWDGGLENNSEFGTSGFTGLPAGCRSPNDGFYLPGTLFGSFWSSSELNSSNAWYRKLDCCCPITFRSNSNKHYGYSIRCLGD